MNMKSQAEIIALWQSVYASNLPTPVVDVSHVWDRMSGRPRLSWFRNGLNAKDVVLAAQKRTAWVYVANVNMILPQHYRCYVTDHSDAIDHIDQALDTLQHWAQSYECTIWPNKWCVWAGKPEVIEEWKRKIGGEV